MSFSRRILLFCLSLLSACTIAPYNTRFRDIQVGMSQEQVVQLLGKPVSKEGGSEGEVLHYRLASSMLDSDGSDTREYWVALKNQRVVAYGERNDEQAMLRSQQQYRAAWGAVGAVNQAPRPVTSSWTQPQFMPLDSSRSSGPTSGRIDGNTVYFNDGSRVRKDGDRIYIDR